mmetsp:Transcript_57/g.299  ORF Transcript_57/g.299 Transcript_57/m.299 type:complete len:226 (-) Transcript_57:2808-3485(-)
MNAASLLGSLPLVWLLLLPSLLRALSSQVLIQSSMPVSLQNPADPDGHHQAENDGEEENGVPSDPLQHGLSQLLCDAKPVLPDGLQPRIQPLPYRRGLLLLQRRILAGGGRRQRRSSEDRLQQLRPALVKESDHSHPSALVLVVRESLHGILAHPRLEDDAAPLMHAGPLKDVLDQIHQHRHQGQRNWPTSILMRLCSLIVVPRHAQNKQRQQRRFGDEDLEMRI